MTSIKFKITTAAILCIVSSFSLTGYGDKKSKTPPTVKKNVVAYEYWVNPDLSTKIRVRLSRPISATDGYSQFRHQIINMLLHTPGVEAWSDMDYQLKNGQGVFTATAWARDLKDVRFPNTHLIPSLSDKDELSLSAKFGSREPTRWRPLRPSENKLSDAEVKQAVKTLRQKLDKELKQFMAIGFGITTSKLVVHTPGKLSSTRNFRQGTNNTLSVDFSIPAVMRALRRALENNEVAEMLIRKSNGVSIRELKKSNEVQDIAHAQLWGKPGLPKATVTGIAKAKPLFDYDKEIQTAQAVALDAQLVKTGLIKLSLPPSVDSLMKLDRDNASVRMGPDWDGTPKRSVTMKAEFGQDLADLPKFTLHRIVDQQGQVLFPAIGIKARYSSNGTHSSRENKMKYRVGLIIIGDIQPEPQTIDVLAEVRYATGVRRKTRLAFDEIKVGATDKKAYNARITKIENLGNRTLICCELNIPKGSKFERLHYIPNDGGVVGGFGRKERGDEDGVIMYTRSMATKDASRIKAVEVTVFDNYKERTDTLNLKDLPIKK